MSEPISRSVALSTGLRYHALEWGAGDAALDHTVVLIHGFLDFSWGWAAMVEAGLAGRYHIVAPDLRGHGDSDRVGAGGYYHFPDYLADLEDFIPRVARRRVSLVGHSMGGSVAAYYAGAFPERVDRLALLEGMGPPEMEDDLPARVRTWVDAWRSTGQRAAKTYGSVVEAAALLAAVDPRLPPGLAAQLAERGTVELPDGRRRFKHDPLHTTPGPVPFRVATATQFWRRIACPVLLVEGDATDFHFAAEDRARRESALHGFRRVVIEGAGHMIQRHQPAALAAALLEFLG